MRTTITFNFFCVPACLLFLAAGQIGLASAAAQTATDAPTRQVEHLLGTVTAVNAAAHTITVKDDKTSSESVISTANTRTLIKVLPGAKDLKGATRITAEDLAVGDRVDIRGFKDEAAPNVIAARSIVLMSARELQAKHQADTAAWQNSTAGVVTSVDSATRTLVITSRALRGSQPVTVQVPASAELTRYSPASPATPANSQFTDIQPGDQVRIIGTPGPNGSSITAQRLYSGAFRTLAGAVISLSPDGKGLTIRNLQTKQPLEVTLSDSTAVHRLPPEMAAMAARRLNGGEAQAGQQGRPGSSPAAAAQPSGQPAAGEGEAHPRPHGDLAQMMQHLPVIAVSDLKPGDAVIVSGVMNTANSPMVASNIIAGVEPILQSPAGRAREGQGLGDWSVDMAVPNQ